MLPNPLLQKDAHRARGRPYAVAFIFLAVTLLSGGDLIEIIPAFAQIVAQPLFPYFHEIHDLLALCVILYAANQIGPATGRWAMAWFLVLHIPYFALTFSTEGPELLRFGLLIVVAYYAISIIAAHGRLEEQQESLAATLEARRAAETLRAQEAETLRQAGAAVATTLRPDEAIERILLQLERVVPYNSASVQLFTEDPARPGEGYLEIVGGRGWPVPAAVVGLRFPVPGDNPNTIAIQQRQPYILGNAATAHTPFRTEPHSHIHSWLGVPLIVRERVIGMLAVDSMEPDHFTLDHARLISAFAAQVAIALENARLFQAEQRRREVAAALLDIAQIAGSSLELDQVLKQIAQQTARACRANRCTIFLLDEAGEVLQPVMSQFADGHIDLEQWRTFKATTADRVEAVPLFRDAIREQRPALLEDSGRIDRIPEKWTRPFGIQKMLAVPLISHDRVSGLMALDHTQAGHEFTPEQVNLALTIGGQVSSAIINARLYAEIQQRADALAMLARLGEALNRAQTADETLQLVLAEAVKLVHDEQGSIILVEPETGALHMFVHVGLALEEVRAFNARRLRADEGTFAYSIGRGQMVEVADTTTDPRVVRDYTATFAQQLTNVPLVTAQGTIGVIALDGLPRNDRDRRLLRALADLAAIAIEKARLTDAAKRQVAELSTLNAIATAGAATTSEDELIEHVTRIVSETLFPDSVGLLLLDQTTGLLRAHASYRTDVDTQYLAIPLGHGITGQVAATGQPRRVADVAADPDYLAVRESTRSELCVPLKTGDRVIGVINAESTRPDAFAESDERLLTTLAGQLATAIEKARLLEETHRRAITDGLTGLFNRRYFFEQAEREFDRASRYKRPLSAIMLDIDHFKQVNDTYGHAVGDQVLRAVARRCRESLRGIDLLSRYGGEEFAALLPENELAGARRAAERLRQHIANAPVDTERGLLNITISLGVAAVSEGCPDLTTLLDRADAAMYAAKKAGRNRVETLT